MKYKWRRYPRNHSNAGADWQLSFKANGCFYECIAWHYTPKKNDPLPCFMLIEKTKDKKRVKAVEADFKTIEDAKVAVEAYLLKEMSLIGQIDNK